MNFWLVLPLFALAQATCYDYEYYDPATGSPVPGNACAQQAANAASASQAASPIGATSVSQFGGTSFGQPQTFSAQIGSITPYATTSFASSATIPTQYGTASTFPTSYVASTTIPSTTTVYSSTVPQTYSSIAPASSQITYSPQTAYSSVIPQTTVYSSTAPIASASYVAPSAVTQVRTTPVAVTTQARSSATVSPQAAAKAAQLASELQYYKDLGERQARQHKENQRIVQKANEDNSRASLVNRLLVGKDNAAPWYRPYRLSNQKEVADAYKSEKRIANKNAEDAYRRFQTEPSHLNLLVSKYQDLNADLRDAAYQYNVVNSGTFGQQIGSFGLGTKFGITKLITQRKQQEDLQDIQKDMKRLGRQISVEAQAKVAATKAKLASASAGSVQERMMGMSVYGPQSRSA